MAVNSGYLTEPRFMSNRREDENSAVEPVLSGHPRGMAEETLNTGSTEVCNKKGQKHYFIR